MGRNANVECDEIKSKVNQKSNGTQDAKYIVKNKHFLGEVPVAISRRELPGAFSQKNGATKDPVIWEGSWC